MKCLTEKQLLAFYYKELTEKQRLLLEAHLRDCRKCSKEYEAIEKTLSACSTPEVEVTPDQRDEALVQIKSRIEEKGQRKFSLQDKIDNLLQNLRYNFYPALKPALAGLVLVSLVTVFFVRRNSVLVSVDRNYDILQIEMELSQGDLENESIFDLAGELEYFNGDDLLISFKIQKGKIV